MATEQKTAIDMLAINNIRCLAADVVQKANSGHPGMPMGMAPVAHILWTHVMNYAPHNPKWINRDRFILSNGHGCALQYILLHLAGYEMSMDDLKSFRQLNSRTPGHPESHLTPGIEVTTGPLGQGFANGVGAAMGQAHLAATYNEPNFPIIDNYTYVFCGDGCLQEGVCCEAASLAGHLGLGRLIVVYDDNRVTIDGHTDLSFSEDVPKRFQAYGWHTITVQDGDHDLDGLYNALEEAKRVTDKPTIISVKTTIGYGATKAGTEAVHGAPLGADDVKRVKTKLGFDPNQSFYVDQQVYDLYATMRARGNELESKWNDLVKAYSAAHPEKYAELMGRFNRTLPANWMDKLPRFNPSMKADATRNISGAVINALASQLPSLIGGSADLTPSNKTEIKGAKDFEKNCYKGRYLRFGVREHAMAAIGNGLAAYGGFIPYTATFLNFLEYCFPAVRLSALSQVQQIFVMTHDSIGLGEDGPTHQPIEVYSLCRATPNLRVFRPADGNETVGAYVSALEHTHGPTVIALSRQNLPHLPNSSVENTLKGAYVVSNPTDSKTPDLILIGSGSETCLAMDAVKELSEFNVRIVSMPSTSVFDQQPAHYRRSIIPPGTLTIAIEALSIFGWERYAHHCIGMNTFGTSGPYEHCYKFFGLTGPQIAATVRQFMGSMNSQLTEMGNSPYTPTSYPALPTHFDLPSNVLNKAMKPAH